MDRIRPGHVRAFLTWRAAHGPDGAKAETSPRTVQKDRAVLHAVFALAEELEIRDGNPVAKVAPPKADPREPTILTPDPFERLLEACKHPMLRLYRWASPAMMDTQFTPPSP